MTIPLKIEVTEASRITWHGRRFDRYLWRGKVFSVRRVQGYSISYARASLGRLLGEES